MEASNSNSNSMLERYRRDREKLLQFLCTSSNLIKEVRTHSGIASRSNLNFDTISTDYVISCINSGGVLDVTEAAKSYNHESEYPVTIHSQSGNSFYFISDATYSGSPPRRSPPQVDTIKNDISGSTSQTQKTLDKKIVVEKKDYGAVHENGLFRPSIALEVEEVPSLGLPPLKSGLSDDDLRESAYEVLVACMVLSGIEILPDHMKKRERGSKILSRLKSKKEKVLPHPQSEERNTKLLDIIRVQMQISEAMDLFIRKRLVRCTSRSLYGQISIPEISLGLLNDISRSSFLNEKSYIQWNARQASMLEELICPVSNHAVADIRHATGRIKNAREWNVMSPSEQAEVLSFIKSTAVKLLPLSGQYSESCHQMSGYHLKIRLYEKLLLALFDVLEEGQLIEETDEVLELVKLTWSTLGITQTVHLAMYCWVLFKQVMLAAAGILQILCMSTSDLETYHLSIGICLLNLAFQNCLILCLTDLLRHFLCMPSDEELLLENATLQVQKVSAVLPCDRKEAQYLNCLLCSCEVRGNMVQLSLLPAVFISITNFCDKALQDYHMYFSQKSMKFRRMLTIAIAVVQIVPNENGELMNPETFSKITSKRLKMFVERSIQAAYARASDSLDIKSKLEKIHPLAVLASVLKLIAEKELAIFFPVLCQWYPKAGMTSATLLHQLFEERLKPFLEGISLFSQDARLVLSAAHSLDQELSQLYSLAYDVKVSHLPLSNNLDHYGIVDVSGPLILDWVISQHSHILDWIGRALDLEVWEPLSSQQKHAVSIIEVFRMIEETVDQLFGLNLPVNITHLQALLSIIIHSLESYMSRLVNQLVEKSYLYPSAPSLTRYEETMVPIVRKKLVETQILDRGVVDILDQLTMSRLCVRLNTLQYVRNQINTLEDGLRKSWGLVRPTLKRRWFNKAEEQLPEAVGRTMLATDESIDELFLTTFDSIRNTATEAISKICDFVGAKAVFWDVRELFLFQLYRGSVEISRMEKVFPHIDGVLNQVCGLIDDVLRDQVVLSIFRALLEGYVWVLLDSGPSRAFSDSDVLLMEDDLNKLKDFFVADGEGIPRSLVEQEAKFSHLVLSLFSHQSGAIIQMLMSASEHISAGVELHRHGDRRLYDADTLIRVLCHKRDREASKFLKRQYQLPASSDYEDNAANESSSTSAVISDLLKKSASFRWPDSGSSSFRSLKEKFTSAW